VQGLLSKAPCARWGRRARRGAGSIAILARGRRIINNTQTISNWARIRSIDCDALLCRNVVISIGTGRRSFEPKVYRQPDAYRNSNHDGRQHCSSYQIAILWGQLRVVIFVPPIECTGHSRGHQHAKNQGHIIRSSAGRFDNAGDGHCRDERKNNSQANPYGPFRRRPLFTKEGLIHFEREKI